MKWARKSLATGRPSAPASAEMTPAQRLQAALRPDQPAPTAAALEKLAHSLRDEGMSQAAPILIRSYKKEAELEVWKRDGGRCALCGATDELHFDHIVPFSKGGTSLTVENVQLLCARHNLQKSDRIE